MFIGFLSWFFVCFFSLDFVCFGSLGSSSTSFTSMAPLFPIEEKELKFTAKKKSNKQKYNKTREYVKD